MNDLSLFDRTVSVACKGDVTMERQAKNLAKDKKLMKQDTYTVEYTAKQKRQNVSNIAQCHARFKKKINYNYKNVNFVNNFICVSKNIKSFLILNCR